MAGHFPSALSRRAALGAMAACGLPRVSTAADQELAPSEADWTPFDDSEGYIKLEGIVNGQATSIQFDSGAQHAIVDRAFAQKIGLQITGKPALTAGMQNFAAGVWSGKVSIQIGRDTFISSQALVLDRVGVTSAGLLPPRPPVILGQFALEGFPMEIDFIRRRLRLISGRSDLTGATRIPLQVQPSRLRAIEVTVEGGAPIWATFDFGCESPLIVDSSLARTNGYTRGRPVSTALGFDIGGRTTTEMATLRKVTLAGMDATAVPFSAQKMSKVSPVYVGLPLIRQLGRIIIDYKSGALFAFPSEFRPAIFERDRFGIMPVPHKDGGWQVAHVAKGSPAARARWKVGDVFVTVDGRRGGSPDNAASARSPNALVVFEMADGSRRTLQPKDYY